MSDNDENVKVTSVIEATLLDYREKVVILHGLSKDRIERDLARLKACENQSRSYTNGSNLMNDVYESPSSEEDENGKKEGGERVLSLRKKKPEKNWCVFMASANQRKPPQGKSQTFHLQTTISSL